MRIMKFTLIGIFLLKEGETMDKKDNTRILVIVISNSFLRIYDSFLQSLKTLRTETKIE